MKQLISLSICLLLSFSLKSEETIKLSDLLGKEDIENTLSKVNVNKADDVFENERDDGGDPRRIKEYERESQRRAEEARKQRVKKYVEEIEAIKRSESFEAKLKSVLPRLKKEIESDLLKDKIYFMIDSMNVQDIEDPKMRTLFSFLVKNGLREDITKSRYVLRHQCLDSDGNAQTLTTTMGQLQNPTLGDDICVDLKHFLYHTQSLFLETLIGLFLHDHARHFGIDDDNHQFAAAMKKAFYNSYPLDPVVYEKQFSMRFNRRYSDSFIIMLSPADDHQRCKDDYEIVNWNSPNRWNGYERVDVPLNKSLEIKFEDYINFEHTNDNRVTLYSNSHECDIELKVFSPYGLVSEGRVFKKPLKGDKLSYSIYLNEREKHDPILYNLKLKNFYENGLHSNIYAHIWEIDGIKKWYQKYYFNLFMAARTLSEMQSTVQLTKSIEGDKIQADLNSSIGRKRHDRRGDFHFLEKNPGHTILTWAIDQLDLERITVMLETGRVDVNKKIKVKAKTGFTFVGEKERTPLDFAHRFGEAKTEAEKIKLAKIIQLLIQYGAHE